MSGILAFGYTQSNGRQGLAAEAAKAIIECGFSRLGAKVRRGAHATWNVQSKRVFEKLGMRFIGENPCGFRKNGKCVEEIEYELTMDDWLEQTGCTEAIAADIKKLGG